MSKEHSNYTTIECTNCGKPADCVVGLQLDEETILCMACGFYYSRKLKRDESGSVITRDGTDNYDMDNVHYQETYIGDPYGSFEFLKQGETEKTGCLATDYDLRKIKGQFDTSDCDKLIIRRLVEGAFTEITITKKITHGKA